MTAEGDFPKAGGDIIYASEVNRFARAGELIVAGSNNFIGVPSGTNYQVAGSFFIAPGSLPSTGLVEINCNTNVQGGESVYLNLTLSGTDFGLSTGSFATVGDGAGRGWMNNVKGYLGLTTNGFQTMGISNQNKLVQRYDRIGQTYPNSGLVLFFNLLNSAGDDAVIEYASAHFKRLSI